MCIIKPCLKVVDRGEIKRIELKIIKVCSCFKNA